MRRKVEHSGRGRGYWTAIVAEFEKSGQRQAEFSEQRGVSLSSLRQWLYRLRRERREAVRAGSGVRFVPLVARGQATAQAAACRVQLGTAEVSFAQLPAADYLGELLRTAGQ